MCLRINRILICRQLLNITIMHKCFMLIKVGLYLSLYLMVGKLLLMSWALTVRNSLYASIFKKMITALLWKLNMTILVLTKQQCKF